MPNKLPSWGFTAVILLVLWGVQPPSLLAQTAGTILGVVSDQSGAVIPGVTLTLKNDATGATRTTQSSASGSYTFALVPPGTYTLTAEKTGFASAVVSNIILEVNASIQRNVTMSLGQVRQQVTVEESPVHLDTSTASIGSVIKSRQIVDLPLNGRDFLQLATLSAGVNPPAIQNGESTTQGALGGGRQTETVSVSGSREISVIVMFDGIPEKQFFYGLTTLQPPVDSIAEFKIQRGYFSPQFGAPAIVNVVTKSGTNSLHGAAWEFFRNDVLDARNFFDRNLPPYRQNQFGFSMGGPAIRNKLFWMGDYEGLRVRQAGTSFYRVPTPAELAGDFSADPTIYDPSTYDPATKTRQPFPGNVIPSGRISSFAQKYNQFIPAPNSAPIASLGNANLVGPTNHVQNDDKWDVRADYDIRSYDRFFGRVSHINSAVSDLRIMPGQSTVSPLTGWNGVFGWTHVFSPTIINEFRAGVDRAFLFSSTPQGAASNPDWPTKVGLANLNHIPDCNGVPTVGMSGYSAFGYTIGNCIITGNTDKLFIDTMEIIRGKHDISLGVDARRVNWRMIAAFTQNGSLSFTGQYSGNSVADYLLGNPFSVSGEAPAQPTYRTGWWPSLFVNDDYHLTSKLTLNLGLRWQYTPPPSEKYNNLFAFNFQTGQMERCGTSGIPENCLQKNWLDFAPRIGIAYSPARNWAIRTSYGIFYDRIPGNEWAWNSISPPFLNGYSAVSDPNVPTIDMTQLFPAPAGEGAPIPVGTSLFDLGTPNRKDGYLQQWTFSLQHTLPGEVFMEIAYIGSKGTHLSKRIDSNLDPSPPAPGDTRSVQERRPYPQWGFILTDEGRANSEYESLQISTRKPLGHGLSFLTGYTFGKSLDNDSYDGKATRNYRPGDMDKGRSIFDMRHRFTAGVVYNLPFGQSLTGMSKQVIAGWQLNTILTFQSGLPFQVTTPSDQSNTGAFWIPRPNRVCDGNLPEGQRTPQHYFDTSCFTLPALNTYGNGGVAYLDTDGLNTVDFAIVKDFPIRESARLQFRAETFNFLNQVNFNRPGSTLDTPSFGVVTSAQPGREIQFALKVMF